SFVAVILRVDPGPVLQRFPRPKNYRTLRRLRILLVRSVHRRTVLWRCSGEQDCSSGLATNGHYSAPLPVHRLRRFAMTVSNLEASRRGEYFSADVLVQY